MLSISGFSRFLKCCKFCRCFKSRLKASASTKVHPEGLMLCKYCSEFRDDFVVNLLMFSTLGGESSCLEWYTRMLKSCLNHLFCSIAYGATDFDKSCLLREGLWA